MSKKHAAGNTQDLVDFIEAGNARTHSNMKDAEGRLENRLNIPTIKCEISDPLQDVFRAQRDSLAQIMDNQVLTFEHIVGRLDNIGNGSGNGNSHGNNNGDSDCPPASEGDKELKVGKRFWLKNYRIQDVISLLVIAALIVVVLSREYLNYQRFKSLEKQHAKGEMTVSSTRDDNK